MVYLCDPLHDKAGETPLTRLAALEMLGQQEA